MGFNEGWQAFEEQVGPLLTDELARQAPVSDSPNDPAPGTLRDSMVWEDQEQTLTVGSRDPRGPIAAYVTRGTAPHPIDPVNATFLHFIGSDGTEVFTRHVDHPGTAPNPFHIAAWEAQRDVVLERFRTVVGHDTLSYLNPWRNRIINLLDM